MLAEAARQAAQAKIKNVQWRRLRADLPAGLGSFRVISFAQSFHWMDQPHVARTALSMLDDDGSCVHVHARTHRGVESDAALPHPRPPRAAMDELVERCLGPVDRTGKGLLRAERADREAEVWLAAGFRGPQRIEVPGKLSRVPVIRLCRRSSLSSSTRTCSEIAGKRSKPIFASCCTRRTAATCSANRCRRSPRRSGDAEDV